MAKRSEKRYVDWLKPGERGWVHGPIRWKWNGRQTFVWSAEEEGWERCAAKPHHFRDGYEREVFPRPAPRRPRTRTVRAWGILQDEGGPLLSVVVTAKQAADHRRFGCPVVLGTFTYSPKARSK